MAVSFERNERANYYIKLGSGLLGTGVAASSDTSVNIGFRSPKALYDSIKKELGVSEVNEKTGGFMLYGKAGEMLPRLSLKLDGGGVNTGLGNDAQSDGSKFVRVFVDPGKLEGAMRGLVGKTTRGRRIISVKIPKRRVYI